MKELADLATIVGLPVAILGALIAFLAWFLPLRKERQIAREFGADSFDDQQISRALRGYVNPDGSPLDPAGADDVPLHRTVRTPLVPAMDKFLSDAYGGKHVLLLADTGMGKTSFLLHYYARNRSKRFSSRKRIAIVPLGRPDTDLIIAAIPSKRETIIFLDAFDEDTQAILDRHARMDELMRACADFQRVVVSFRTQFFASDEEIPKTSGIARVGPRKGGVERIYRFQTLYLVPFSDAQIREFLRMRFGSWQLRKRKMAQSIVKAIPELSARPMLLAVIPDLVEQGDAASDIYQLYEFMISRWLEREQDWIDASILRGFSETLALDLYVHQSDRRMARISKGELAALIEINTAQLEEWKLTSRSLLNRDGEGNYKFAHRSIMEFLIVAGVIDGRVECLQCGWTNFMRQLFLSWVNGAVSRGQMGVHSILANDFQRTGMFPIFEIGRQSAKLSESEILHPTRDVTRTLFESNFQSSIHRLIGTSQFPRTAFVSAFLGRDALLVVDVANDSVFVVPVYRPVGQLEFGTPRSTPRGPEGVNAQLDAVNKEAILRRVNWRAPTLDEIDLLLLVNDRYPSIHREMFYWSSDRTEAGDFLVVSISHFAASNSSNATLIGSRSSGGTVFSVPIMLGAPPATSSLFMAHLILVSYGGAQALRQELATSPSYSSLGAGRRLLAT